MKANKKKYNEMFLIGLGLIVLSIILHFIHVIIFKDVHHTMIFWIADIAFIPMEVFFTTLIIERLLESREKKHHKEKLNMLVGVFYTEIGSQLLSTFAATDAKVISCKKLQITDSSVWDEIYYRKLKRYNREYDYTIPLTEIDFEQLKETLHANKNLLITLATNESLHDHETFTKLIMLLLHLKEELDMRTILELNQKEKDHLANDIAELYLYLTKEWCHYMHYLNQNYPGLFETAVMLSPFTNQKPLPTMTDSN